MFAKHLWGLNVVWLGHIDNTQCRLIMSYQGSGLGVWIDVQYFCFVCERTFFMLMFNLSVVIRHLVGFDPHLTYMSLLWL